MPRSLVLFALSGLFLSIGLLGCNDEVIDTNMNREKITVSEGWPKTISTSHGDITLKTPPKRIVSTSVSITGTLLTIDAPVIASGGTRSNTLVADNNGFFNQWSDVAHERGVKALYQGVANTEAIAKEKPDLIVVSATGGDSALKLYEQFSTIAPTLVVNYDDKSWQELAQLLAKITDKEARATAVITEFEAKLNALKKRLVLPPQPVSALVYYGDGRGGNFWTTESAQGQVLTALGFSLSPLPNEFKNNHQMGKRKDIVPVNGENFADAITGNTVLLFAANDEAVEQVKTNKFIAHLPAITQGHVFPMGADSFRLDYYSSVNLLNTLDATFSQ